MFKEFHYQVRGRGHVRDGSPGQDRVQYASRGGVQALCLADGAGSAARSEVGAQIVVDRGAALLIDRFPELISSEDGAQVKLGIVTELLSRLEEAASRLECDVKDLASTFLAVVTLGEKFIVAHIGDGVIGYVKQGEVRVVSSPDNSEFANQTTFVTSSGAARSMRLLRGSLDGVTGFILMSDGASDSLYDAKTPALAPACERMIEIVGLAPSRAVKDPAHKKQLRKLIDTKVRTATKDDCSVGILARRLFDIVEKPTDQA